MNSEKEKIAFESPPPDNKSTTSIIAAANKNAIANTHTPIISFSGKKKRIHFSLRRLIIPLFALILASLLIGFYAETHLSDEICELAKARAEKHLYETVNETVGALAKAGKLQYDNMVKTIRDPSGEVIYLEVNTGMLAAAQSDLIARINQGLEEKKSFTLTLPLGSISGWNLFSGVGIPIRVRMFPISSANGEIFTVLEDCGINQTRHLIQIHVTAQLLVVLPGENTRVETKVTLPLGERVLVGDVPEIYLDTLGIG